MSRKNDIDQLVKELRRKGCIVTPTKSGRWRVTKDGTVYVSMASTPSGRYAINVIRRDLRNRLGVDV